MVPFLSRTLTQWRGDELYIFLNELNTRIDKQTKQSATKRFHTSV